MSGDTRGAYEAALDLITPTPRPEKQRYYISDDSDSDETAERKGKDKPKRRIRCSLRISQFMQGPLSSVLKVMSDEEQVSPIRVEVKYRGHTRAVLESRLPFHNFMEQRCIDGSFNLEETYRQEYVTMVRLPLSYHVARLVLPLRRPPVPPQYHFRFLSHFSSSLHLVSLSSSFCRDFIPTLYLRSSISSPLTIVTAFTIVTALFLSPPAPSRLT